MEYTRFLECLTSDFDRLRGIVLTAPDAAVPSCPGWTVADLTRHLGEVYLEKAKSIRDGVEPESWPPQGLNEEEPLAVLDRGYADLRHEFATHKPEDPSGNWYAPNRTVGFQIRRMAQETVIHRIDAELGTGQPIAPVPDDLAIDGIDELLKIFVAYGVQEWGSSFADALGNSPGRSYAVVTDGAAWQIRTGPGQFTVEDGQAGEVDVTVSGTPTDVLRWLWNRAGDATVVGDEEAVRELRRCITTATQ